MKDEAGDRGRADRLHLTCGTGGRRHPGRAQRAEELPQEQGIAAGCGVAGAAELVVGVAPEPLAGQRRRRGLAERSRVERERIRT